MLLRAPPTRAGMDGTVTGVELAPAIRLAELAGYDLPVLARLLPMGAAGMANAVRDQDEG